MKFIMNLLVTAILLIGAGTLLNKAWQQTHKSGAAAPIYEATPTEVGAALVAWINGGSAEDVTRLAKQAQASIPFLPDASLHVLCDRTHAVMAQITESESGRQVITTIGEPTLDAIAWVKTTSADVKRWVATTHAAVLARIEEEVRHLDAKFAFLNSPTLIAQAPSAAPVPAPVPVAVAVPVAVPAPAPVPVAVAPVVVPVPVAPRAPVVAAAPPPVEVAPVAPPAVLKVPAAKAPVAATTGQSEVRSAAGLTVGQRGCIFGGLAGSGATLVIGPAEVAAWATGSVLLPASARIIGTVLGTALVSGCAAGALISPAISR